MRIFFQIDKEPDNFPTERDRSRSCNEKNFLVIIFIVIIVVVVVGGGGGGVKKYTLNYTFIKKN